MKTFVRLCALYNVSGAVVFLTPGLLEVLGVRPPGAALWLWLPSLFAVFAALTLLYSSADLRRHGSLPYWNACIRLTFVVLVFALDLAAAGAFIRWLAAGDLVLALVVLVGLPRATGRGVGSLLANRDPA